MIMFEFINRASRYNITQPKVQSDFDHRLLPAKVTANQINYTLQGSNHYPIWHHPMAAKYFSEEYWDCIGLLRSQWLNPRTKQVKIICYGTAFIVASRFIITCGHNVYNDDDCTTADRCLFIPNHNGKVHEGTPILQSAKGVFCRYIPFKKDQDICAKPSPSEICVLVTEKEIVDVKKFITLGLCNIRVNQQIEAIGYPSRQFSSKPNLFEIDIKRRVEKGQVSSIRGSIEYGQFKTISYNLKTKKGMSGSPLFYRHNGETVCVGIHTHGMEKGVKSGVFFNEFAIKTIKNFEQQLANQYTLTPEIQYYIAKKQSPQYYPVLEYKFIGSPDQSQIFSISDDQFQQIYNLIRQQLQLIINQENSSIQIQLNKTDLIQYYNNKAMPHHRLVHSQ